MNVRLFRNVRCNVVFQSLDGVMSYVLVYSHWYIVNTVQY